VPVTYSIDANRRIIRTKCIGQVTLEEVIGHFRALEQDPDCPDRLDVLLDLTETDSLPANHQVRAVGYELKRIRERVRFEACAILTCSDALFGMMRMFEVTSQAYFRVTHVFRVAAEAEAWLLSQQTPVHHDQ